MLELAELIDVRERARTRSLQQNQSAQGITSSFIHNKILGDGFTGTLYTCKKVVIKMIFKVKFLKN